MAKIKYDAVDLKYVNKTEEGRKYLEYNDKVGGEPIGMMVGLLQNRKICKKGRQSWRG